MWRLKTLFYKLRPHLRKERILGLGLLQPPSLWSSLRFEAPSP